MNPIRLLVDGRVMTGEGQGSATYLKGLYNGLQERYGESYELFFAGYDFAAMKAAFPFIKKEQFIPLTTESRLKLLFFEFPRIIEEYQIQFAHFQYVTPFIKNCKFIVTTHDVLFNDFKADFPLLYRLKRNFLFKQSLQKSEVCLTVSRYSQERIAEHYDLLKESIKITPNAVRAAFFEKYDAEAVQERIEQQFGAKNYLLYLSRIEPRKNHQMVMDAYRKLELHQENIQLVFVGSDTLKSKKETDQINKMKQDFPAHFHWLSGLTDEEVLDIYRGARLFVYPSKAEGFGIPPIEAAAAGIPTICSNATAMQDFDFFGNNCFSPENLEELTMKIRNELDRPMKNWKRSDIQESIQQKYNWTTSANVLHEWVVQESITEIIPAKPVLA